MSSPDGWIATGKVSSSLGKIVQEKSSLTASVITDLDLRGSSNDKLPFWCPNAVTQSGWDYSGAPTRMSQWWDTTFLFGVSKKKSMNQSIQQNGFPMETWCRSHNDLLCFGGQVGRIPQWVALGLPVPRPQDLLPLSSQEVHPFSDSDSHGQNDFWEGTANHKKTAPIHSPVPTHPPPS